MDFSAMEANIFRNFNLKDKFENTDHADPTLFGDSGD